MKGTFSSYFQPRRSSRRNTTRRVAPRPRLELLEDRLAPAVTVPGLPTPDHIVIVMLENHSYNEIIGNTQNAPYLNSLAQQGAIMTNSFAVQHPSQPNYIELFSGSNQG